MTKAHPAPENPEAAKTGPGFPLPLLRSPGKCTIVWTIAGFDPSGGAGITADLMSFAAHELFGCSAITALTVQSTMGVFGWDPVSPELLRETLDRLFEDLPPLGIKLGMLGTPVLAGVIGEFLDKARSTKSKPVVVFDPVLRSSSGRELYPQEAVESLHQNLMPHVDWITPNWAELALLSGLPVVDLASAEEAGRALLRRHPGLVLVATGGDQETPTDVLVPREGDAVLFRGERVATQATHGTGCAFSSALLARLVGGAAPVEAVRGAKGFVEGALRHAPGIGRGRGPMGLLWPLLEEDRGGSPVGSLER